MNIQQLLSASQSSPQAMPQGALSRQVSPSGSFQQVLLQASDGQRLSELFSSDGGSTPATALSPSLDALHGHLSELNVDNLGAALSEMGLDISKSDLSSLLAQLQLANLDINSDSLNSAEAVTALDEITARLDLIAAFSDDGRQTPAISSVDPAVIETIAEHLDIEPSEAAQLIDMMPSEAIAQYLGINQAVSVQEANTSALKAIVEKLDTNSSKAAQLGDIALPTIIAQALNVDQRGPVQPIPLQPIDTGALKAVATQLDINQSEAAQLVSSLNGSVIKELGARPLPADAARLSTASMPPVAIQPALGSSPDNWLAQLNTGNAAAQISSEALMGALLTSQGTPKGHLAGESLLTTGFTLPSGSGPLASVPQAQGFAPTVAPTQAILSTPFTSPAWPQQLGQQLVQISQRGGEQHVQMQLHPAELGPLSISLKFGEQGAQAHFLSAHAQVRQVLEQALPQLREALAEQGISLGETSVGEQRDSNTQNFAQSGGRQGAELGSDGDNTTSDETLNRDTESSPLRLDGRVDLYA